MTRPLEVYDRTYMQKRYFLWVLMLALPLSAQEPKGEGGRPGGPPPEPKNLQVLKVKGPELIAIMRNFNTALGFRCDNCHVQGNFASDEKHEKVVARKMLEMTMEINGRFPKREGQEARMNVTCYTCHRGQEHPLTAPPEAAAPSGEAKH
jgi:hypothetical protein